MKKSITIVKGEPIPISELEKTLKPIVIENIKHRKKEEPLIMFEIYGEEIYALSDRYKTFFTKGLKCVSCGAECTYAKLQKNVGDERYHLEFYVVEDGKEMIFTKDHIKPRSLGGQNALGNYQPMCRKCNVKKGNKYKGNKLGKK